jgi:hypothetical protein
VFNEKREILAGNSAENFSVQVHIFLARIFLLAKPGIGKCGPGKYLPNQVGQS